MSNRETSPHQQLGMVERALQRAARLDPSFYDELLRLRKQLEEEAARADADANLTRAEATPADRSGTPFAFALRKPP